MEEMDLHQASTVIQCDNFLKLEELPGADLIVTSPPYVTSYEYADLHQLSSLWLQYANDYRELRRGSIGSVYNSEGFQIDFDGLNDTGRDMVRDLIRNCGLTSKVKSVARYFSDMQRVIEKCSVMLNPDGMILFVIGDTEYKGVKIQNARHLVESLEENGYTDIKISKRTISKGICVPYRDEKGKFSTNKSNRKVYHFAAIYYKNSAEMCSVHSEGRHNTAAGRIIWKYGALNRANMGNLPIDFSSKSPIMKSEVYSYDFISGG